MSIFKFTCPNCGTEGSVTRIPGPVDGQLREDDKNYTKCMSCSKDLTIRFTWKPVISSVEEGKKFK